MMDENYINKKGLKIINRAFKEANIFLSEFYKIIFNYIVSNETYIFYGFDGCSYSKYGVRLESKIYKLQLDIAKKLIEEEILNKEDYFMLAKDTLLRYNLNSYHSSFIDKWERVVTYSEKQSFIDFFVPILINKFGAKYNLIADSIKKTVPM